MAFPSICYTHSRKNTSVSALWRDVSFGERLVTREHRDLKFYADAMGLTPKHISTVVKASSGRSAVEWIERYVVLDAQTQLISTDRTIKEIAYDLNFPSQSFFGKYFCRVVGISPAAYRNRSGE